MQLLGRRALATFSPSRAILLKLRRFLCVWLWWKCQEEKSNKIKRSSNSISSSIYTRVSWKIVNTCSHFFSAGSHIFVVRRHTLSRLNWWKIRRLDLLMGLLISSFFFFLLIYNAEKIIEFIQNWGSLDNM